MRKYFETYTNMTDLPNVLKEHSNLVTDAYVLQEYVRNTAHRFSGKLSLFLS